MLFDGFFMLFEGVLERSQLGSHVIFSLSFEAHGASSKLNIVDLAGCENHKHEASEDGRHINRSLFFLGEAPPKRILRASKGPLKDIHKTLIKGR